MSVWYILLVIVMSDGRVVSDVRYPNTPDVNNEQSCNMAGEYLMEQEQMKIGTDSGKVFFQCKEITGEQIRAATTKGTGA